MGRFEGRYLSGRPSDKRYDSAGAAEFFRCFFESGVIALEDNLRVEAVGAQSAYIHPGKALLDGYLVKIIATEEEPYLISAPEDGKWGRVVLRAQKSGPGLYVKEGTSEEPPALERGNGVYEISLARICCGQGGIIVVDERAEEALCGVCRRAPELETLPLIPSGSDFNDYLEPGIYGVRYDSDAEGIANCPTDVAGRLEVWYGNGQPTETGTTSYRIQRYTTYTGSVSWTRYIHTIETGGWVYDSWLNDGLKSYPVGSYYFANHNTSPAKLFGGTWERISGRFLWACGSSSTLGATGGESEHVLTVNEMPRHQHDVQYAGTSGSGYGFIDSGQARSSNMQRSSFTGGGAAHNNMPPFINVAVWRRTT